MSDQKIPALLALSLISSPIALPATTPSYSDNTKTVSTTISSEATSKRAAVRRMQHQLAPMPTLQPMGTYLGELQEKWQFPSDHLPIGMTFDNLNFVSWNVLDAEYMSWVTEKNSQGLSRSMIADEHVYVGNSKLTVRDKHVVDLILQTIFHPTHPRSILSLQECSKPFIEELRSRLPAHVEVISNHGDAVLLDRRRFGVVEAKEVPGIFTDDLQRTLQDITLCRLDNGQPLRLINVHLPGDPTKPGRFEFAQYLAKTFDPSLTTLAMGDMNFDELEMADAMKQAFQNNSPFSLNSPYCTNISSNVFNSKAIDHFLVYSPSRSSVELNTPDQIMPGLAPVVALLQVSFSSAESETQSAFQYFLSEVELDATLTHEEQNDKIQEFKIFADTLSPEAASLLTSLLIEETRSRIIDMLQNAGLNKSEVDGFLAGYKEAVLKVQNMNVEIAREMLFFVAELKIHRQYVYDFGIALGCPEKQLLLHDLCKLDVEQFEGYARYFRGGRQDEDKVAYLAAWEHHQYEEHHHESYSKEGFDFDNFPEERLRNNMLESVADLLASSKQRGGGTLTDWLVNNYPKKHPHPRLLPFFKEALMKAHVSYLKSEENLDSELKIFQGLPCWNSDLEEVFRNLSENK